MGGKRIEMPTGTNKLSVAQKIRDRVINPIKEEVSVSEFTRRLLTIVRQSETMAIGLLRMAEDDLGVNIPSGPVFNEAMGLYIESRKNLKNLQGGTLEDYQRSLVAFLQIIGNKQLTQYTRKDMRDFRDALLKLPPNWMKKKEKERSVAVDGVVLKKRTVSKMVKNIVTFFNWAMKEEHISTNPGDMIDLPSTDSEKTKAPSSDQANALCCVPPPGQASKVGVLEWEVLPWFYRYTGARLGEIAQLLRQDVVEEHGMLCLHLYTEKTSTRKGAAAQMTRRLVPVHPKLQPYLEKVLARECGEQLFPYAGHSVPSEHGTIRYGQTWSKLYNRKAKAIWSEMHVHCWRAYAITEMARAGVAEEVRRKVVGHVTQSVHDGYNQVDLMRVQEGVFAIP